jgi:hypothetical protein
MQEYTALDNDFGGRYNHLLVLRALARVLMAMEEDDGDEEENTSLAMRFQRHKNGLFGQFHQRPLSDVMRNREGKDDIIQLVLKSAFELIKRVFAPSLQILCPRSTSEPDAKSDASEVVSQHDFDMLMGLMKLNVQAVYILSPLQFYYRNMLNQALQARAADPSRTTYPPDLVALSDFNREVTGFLGELPSVSGSALYPIYSLINHSCGSDCCIQTCLLGAEELHTVFHEEHSRAQVSVYAEHDLTQGTELLGCYLPNEVLAEPVYVRRRESLRMLGFLCECARCLQEMKCAHCGYHAPAPGKQASKPIPKPCSQCKSAYFCDRECLKLGWKLHKGDCAKAVQEAAQSQIVQKLPD